MNESGIRFYNSLVHAAPLEAGHFIKQAFVGIYRVVLSTFKAKLKANMAEVGV